VRNFVSFGAKVRFYYTMNGILLLNKNSLSNSNKANLAIGYLDIKIDLLYIEVCVALHGMSLY